MTICIQSTKREAAARDHSRRRRRHAVEGPPTEATVKWFNPEKGFGFVTMSDGTGDVFLHISVFQAAGRESILPGAKLRAHVGPGKRDRQVSRILEIDESSATAEPPRSRQTAGYRAACAIPLIPLWPLKSVGP